MLRRPGQGEDLTERLLRTTLQIARSIDQAWHGLPNAGSASASDAQWRKFAMQYLRSLDEKKILESIIRDEGLKMVQWPGYRQDKLP